MGDASFERRAEMISRPLALLLGIFWIKLKTSWHDTSANLNDKDKQRKGEIMSFQCWTLLNMTLYIPDKRRFCPVFVMVSCL